MVYVEGSLGGCSCRLVEQSFNRRRTDPSTIAAPISLKKRFRYRHHSSCRHEISLPIAKPLRLSQPPILRRRQAQIASTPTVCYRVPQPLPALRITPSLSTPSQLSDLLRVCERQLPRQRRLKVRLEKLNVPALTQEERHVDPMAGTVAARHPTHCRAKIKRNYPRRIRMMDEGGTDGSITTRNSESQRMLRGGGCSVCPFNVLQCPATLASFMPGF